MSSSAPTELVLPAWAVATPKRRAHIARVAALVAGWANARGLPPDQKARWLRAAELHDVVRDADASTLRGWIGGEFADWPDQLLHGPAAAARLRAEGFADEGILTAVAYHTLGHPDLDDAGRALYLADFLEPGRTFDPISCSTWRARMPDDMEGVLCDVLAARIQHVIAAHRPLRLETLAFWNQVSAR